MEYEQLVKQALNQPSSGWDFSWAKDRWIESELNWNYRQLVEQRIERTSTLLDMGTGGGEFLTSLDNIPEKTLATEGYTPNIPIARETLKSKGVEVVPVSNDDLLEFDDESFDLIINRHGSYDLSEVWRVLKPQGIFLTQQVGPKNCIQVNQFLQAPVEQDCLDWKFSIVMDEVINKGFQLLNSQEQLLDSIFYDIGAIIIFLRIIEWQIPDFSIEKYDQRLRDLHLMIEEQGKFVAKAHRYLIEVYKS